MWDKLNLPMGVYRVFVSAIFFDYLDYVLFTTKIIPVYDWNDMHGIYSQLDEL